MNRAQRKANLKKILKQNSRAVENSNTDIDADQPRQTRSSKRQETTTSISKFFNEQANAGDTGAGKRRRRINDKQDIVSDNPTSTSAAATAKTCNTTPAKRMNLTRFIFKDSKDMPVQFLKVDSDSDAFETPVKKVKRAPKLRQPAGASKRANIKRKARKPERQPKINSAFLRNEQIFSEITAQHCLAENFSPDDVQLALALSRSEVESKDTASNGVNSKEIVIDIGAIDVLKNEATAHDIRSKLQKFGFRTGAKEDYNHCLAAAFRHNQRRPKTKWANKFTALTLRDPEKQVKKLDSKVDAILKRQELKIKSRFFTESRHETYHIHSTLLTTYGRVTPERQIFREVKFYAEERTLQQYFVSELFPVSSTPAGYLLKNWASIPGRDISPARDSDRQKKRKFDQFYTKLDKILSNHVEADIIEAAIKESLLDSREKSKSPPENSNSQIELDDLLRLISETNDKKGKETSAQDTELLTTSPKVLSAKKPIKLVASYNSNLSSSLSSTPSNGSQIISTLAAAIVTTNSRQMRPSSPDLFADSDGEELSLAAVANQRNNITIYESYSSDDANYVNEMLSVKATIDNKENSVVDLTQESLEEDIDNSNDDMAVKISKHSIENTLNKSKKPNLDIYDECMPSSSITRNFNTNAKTAAVDLEFSKNNTWASKKCYSFDLSSVGGTEKNMFSNPIETDIENSLSFNAASMKDSTNSVDLTQSDEDDINDVCLLLSDDEINYSILKSRRSKTDISSKQLHDNKEHNFSILDLIDAEKSFQTINRKQKFDNTFAKNTTFDLSPPIEDLESSADECQTTPSKTENLPETPRRSQQQSIHDLLKQQRAEFGILESQSEPYTQTPPHWKNTPQEYDSPYNVSDDRIVSRKHFSSTNRSRKFDSFLFEDAPHTSDRNNIDAMLIDEDFDEFDRLVYGSPPPKQQRFESNVEHCRTPTGLHQLLTAEISCTAYNTAKTVEENLQSPSKQLLTTETVTASTCPEEEEIKINDHIYYVRVTNSPKPNFAKEPEAELLKQLYNFGIKPLKRNQAIKMLEHIYNQTHPIMKPAAKLPSDADDEYAVDDDDEVQVCVAASRVTQLAVKSRSTGMLSSQEIVTSDIATSDKSKKYNLQDGSGEMMVRFARELSAELCNEEEVYIFQTNVTKKTQQPLVPLHIAWFNLVCSNVSLHESVLMYEPIDLQEIYLFLKSIGYRFDPKDLKNFFDRRCIIFRYDLTPPEKQKDRHTHKKIKDRTRNLKTSLNSKTSTHSLQRHGTL